MSLPWRQLEHAPAHVTRADDPAYPALTRWTITLGVAAGGPHADELDLPEAALERDEESVTVFRATGVTVDLRHPEAGSALASQPTTLTSLLPTGAAQVHLVTAADLAPAWQRYPDLHTWLAHRALATLVSEGDLVAASTDEPVVAWARLGLTDAGTGYAVTEGMLAPVWAA